MRNDQRFSNARPVRATRGKPPPRKSPLTLDDVDVARLGDRVHLTIRLSMDSSSIELERLRTLLESALRRGIES